MHGADRPEPGGGAKCEHTVVACRTATLRGGGGRWRAGPRDLPVLYQFAFSPTWPGLLIPTALPPSRPAACLHAGRGEAAAAVNAYQQGILFRHQALKVRDPHIMRVLMDAVQLRGSLRLRADWELLVGVEGRGAGGQGLGLIFRDLGRMGRWGEAGFFWDLGLVRRCRGATRREWGWCAWPWEGVSSVTWPAPNCRIAPHLIASSHAPPPPPPLLCV